MNSASIRRPVRVCVVLVAILMLGCSDQSTDIVDDEPEDHVPPATVTDLRVLSPTPTSLTLRWTAPGDDGDEGFAVSYDLRGAIGPITGENFDGAVAVDLENPPLPPGATESETIDSLEPGQSYFFALKTRDDAGNVSGLSNCAEGFCPEEQTIQIPDAALEALLRQSLQVATGDLHLSDMLRLIELAGNEQGIADVTGLETAANLKIANLLGNQISDPSPLGQLPGLEALNLTMNQLTDLSSLQDLTDLVQFGCGQNQLTDVSVVSGMTRLQSLSIHANPLTELPLLENLTQLTEINLGGLDLTDLSVLDGRTTLRILVASGNRIDDISALAALPELESVFLAYNQITDLAPLVGNVGFAQGDQLDVRGNPLSSTALEEQIPALTVRGVVVEY